MVTRASKSSKTLNLPNFPQDVKLDLAHPHWIRVKFNGPPMQESPLIVPPVYVAVLHLARQDEIDQHNDANYRYGWMQDQQRAGHTLFALIEDKKRETT